MPAQAAVEAGLQEQLQDVTQLNKSLESQVDSLQKQLQDATLVVS